MRACGREQTVHMVLTPGASHPRTPTAMTQEPAAQALPHVAQLAATTLLPPYWLATVTSPEAGEQGSVTVVLDAGALVCVTALDAHGATLHWPNGVTWRLSPASPGTAAPALRPYGWRGGPGNGPGLLPFRSRSHDDALHDGDGARPRARGRTLLRMLELTRASGSSASPSSPPSARSGVGGTPLFTPRRKPVHLGSDRPDRFVVETAEDAWVQLVLDSLRLSWSLRTPAADDRTR